MGGRGRERGMGGMHAWWTEGFMRREGEGGVGGLHGGGGMGRSGGWMDGWRRGKGGCVGGNGEWMRGGEGERERCVGGGGFGGGRISLGRSACVEKRARAAGTPQTQCGHMRCT